MSEISRTGGLKEFRYTKEDEKRIREEYIEECLKEQEKEIKRKLKERKRQLIINKQKIKELEEKRDFLKKLPFYSSENKKHSILLIIFILLTGIIIGIIIIKVYRFLQIENINDKIKKLSIV